MSYIKYYLFYFVRYGVIVQYCFLVLQSCINIYLDTDKASFAKIYEIYDPVNVKTFITLNVYNVSRAAAAVLRSR